MKKIAIIVLLLLTLQAYAQEFLSPLTSTALPCTPKSSDTLVLELPFFDDFSNYTGLPDSKRWLSYEVLINQDYAPFPPSIGVATLDALDANGDLYPQATTSIFPADTLASQIIRLDSITGPSRRALNPSDSISLSFYYIPGGWYGNAWELVGDSPSSSDTLFLEFYDATVNKWNIVWCTPGFDVDTSGIVSKWPWKYVYIKIDSQNYLNKKFQFRFRNYASLDANPKSGISGNCDQWNIDYVFLSYNRSISDSVIRDIAFVSKAPSFLKSYQAMPAAQFRPEEMASDVHLTIVNRYNQTLASTYAYHVYDSDGNEIESYNGGYENIGPFFPLGHYQTASLHANPNVDFTFPYSADRSSYSIMHIVSEGVGGDIHTCNDTITFTQNFYNYYAYDDGVPENGYGITSAGSHQWLAYLFPLNQPDTLTALDIYFNRTRNSENEDINFQISIWECHNGEPGELIYKDPAHQTPQFQGLNHFHRYILSEPQIVHDTVFIGFEQLSNKYINIGFDRSNNSSQRLYYRTGAQWQQSFLSGSIMMRPVFGESAQVGIPVNRHNLISKIYPNPSSDQIHIELSDEQSNDVIIEIIDMIGRTILRRSYTETIDISQIPAGLYLLRLTDSHTAEQHLEKIIIK